MFRVGTIELRGSRPTLNRRLYREVSSTLPAVVDSFIGYFGSSEFLRLLANPWSFSLFCSTMGVDNVDDVSSVVLVVSALSESLRSEWGIGLAGGLYNKRFTVPQMVEHYASAMGLSDKHAGWLKYSSRMAAKVDDAAVQDGFRLWLHVMIFNSDAEWTVLQVASKAGLSRLYQWHSGRVSVTRFTYEPHTGISSATRSSFTLDFTFRKNLELQKGCLEVLEQPISRLKSVMIAARKGQTRLSDFKGDEGTTNSHPFNAPIRIGWSTLEKLAGSRPNDFEELLAMKGVGHETLRFLAICCHSLLGIAPSFEDKAMLFSEILIHAPPDNGTQQMVWDLVEAVRLSLLTSEKRRIMESRLITVLEGRYGGAR